MLTMMNFFNALQVKFETFILISKCSILNLFRRIGQKKMVVMEIWIPTTVLADFLVFGRE
jgi:hypothetical protein